MVGKPGVSGHGGRGRRFAWRGKEKEKGPWPGQHRGKSKGGQKKRGPVTREKKKKRGDSTPSSIARVVDEIGGKKKKKKKEQFLSSFT